MEGLARPAVSLRPTADAVSPSLPRRVLRHLVVAHGLGFGSRVIVGGDQSEAVAALLTRLGIEAENADIAPLTAGRYDATIWLDLEPAPAGERSLLSSAAIGRTARLLAAVRPAGHFLFVSAVSESPQGHGVACLERHLATFPGRTRTSFFARRPMAGLFSGSRAGYAVAAWQAPTAPVEPALWRRKATTAASTACCEWAKAMPRPRKAA